MKIGKIGNSKFNEKVDFVVILKHDNKKTPFCMSSNKLFLKYGLQNNNWVGHSVMKPVDDVAFKKTKALREGNNEKSDYF